MQHEKKIGRIVNASPAVQLRVYILVGAEKVSHGGGSNKVCAPLWERFGPNLLFGPKAHGLRVSRFGTRYLRAIVNTNYTFSKEYTIQ